MRPRLFLKQARQEIMARQNPFGGKLLLIMMLGAPGPALSSSAGAGSADCGREQADHREDHNIISSPAPLPEGFRRIDSFEIDRSLTYDWKRFEIYLSSWHNGVQTTGDPDLLTWNSDGSVTLEFCGDGKAGRSGMLKLVRPTKGKGKWGAIVEVTKPDAVAAFFLYAKNGKEIDFELTRQNGVLSWSPNVWMPTQGGGKTSRQGPPLNMPFSWGAQLLEVEFDESAAVFFVDGVERARIGPEDMPPDSIWDVNTPFDAVFSVESHGPWAGQSYSDRRASMTVYALHP